ncbi:MAG: S41 family peptidase [Muribaculaceae bacterium]|nr:S41 family peptidase [Muribaculaceae bacterium]
MKRLMKFIMAVTVVLIAGACHRLPHFENDPEGNFDALWSILDTHYCYFREKGIDWDSVYSVYRPKVTPETGAIELFTICSAMLDELRDGHVNLSTPFATSYYKKWWSDYPQNYDARLVEQYYLNFGGFSRNGLTYAILPDSVGYMRYTSFSYTLSDLTLDYALALLNPCKGLIIDVRDNGGGELTNVETLVARFIDRRITAGYISHKSGPGHGDFSEPYEYYFDPAPAPRIHWEKPVAILTNRSTFSAANNFVAVMHALSAVRLIGDTTGGGSGMPFSSEIPCGWSVRFSGSPVYESNMLVTEFGIAPDIHVDLDPEKALDGIDTMLDAAVDDILQRASGQKQD